MTNLVRKNDANTRYSLYPRKARAQRTGKSSAFSKVQSISIGTLSVIENANDMPEFNLIKLDDKPIEKLVKVISKGIGVLFKPRPFERKPRRMHNILD